MWRPRRRGGRDDDLLRAGGQVLGGRLARREHAGRLDDDVDLELAPGQRERATFGEDLDGVLADLDVVVDDG